MHEAFTWILKKQSVSVPGIDTIAIKLTAQHNQDTDHDQQPADQKYTYTVFTPGGGGGGGKNVEVNNILKTSIDAVAKPKCMMTKTPSSEGEIDRGVVSAASSHKAKGEGKTNESGYISEEDKKSEDECEQVFV